MIIEHRIPSMAEIERKNETRENHGEGLHLTTQAETRSRKWRQQSGGGGGQGRDVPSHTLSCSSLQEFVVVSSGEGVSQVVINPREG